MKALFESPVSEVASFPPGIRFIAGAIAAIPARAINNPRNLTRNTFSTSSPVAIVHRLIVQAVVAPIFGGFACCGHDDFPQSAARFRHYRLFRAGIRGMAFPSGKCLVTHKWVEYGQLLNALAVLHVFAVQAGTAGLKGGGDDEGIVEGEAVATLEYDSVLVKGRRGIYLPQGEPGLVIQHPTRASG